MRNQQEYLKWNKRWKKFQKENKQSITKMVLDFERKKSASISKRIRKKDTGVINERILHTYKWNEKLFKTRKIVPEGKNHGMIMLVDCSGSMQQLKKFENTIKQTLMLVEFCRKAGIKYKVMGFSDGRYGARGGEIEYKNCDSKKHLELRYLPVLREWFSHEQSLSQHDFMSTYMLFKTKKHRSINQHDGPNSSTPLLDSIFLLRQVALKFKKDENIDILNTITLTDGDSNPTNFVIKDELGSNTKLCSFDPLTKSVYRTSNSNSIEDLLKFYKKVVGGNVISFNIVNYWYEKEPIHIKENYLGYDNYYTFSYDNVYGSSKRTKFDGHIDSVEELQKKFNTNNVNKNNQKVLLSKFIDIIS